MHVHILAGVRGTLGHALQFGGEPLAAAGEAKCQSAESDDRRFLHEFRLVLTILSGADIRAGTREKPRVVDTYVYQHGRAVSIVLSQRGPAEPLEIPICLDQSGISVVGYGLQRRCSVPSGSCRKVLFARA